MARYTYVVPASYDVGKLDTDIQNSSLFEGLSGVSVYGLDMVSANLAIDFEFPLDSIQKSMLQNLIISCGSDISVYRLWCTKCQKWFEIAFSGRPVYCYSCNFPFQLAAPRGNYIWSDPGQSLRRWAEIKFFVYFNEALASVPHGGVEISDISLSNVSSPVILEIYKDKFLCTIQVGIINAMWQDLYLKFSWKVIL